MSELANHKGWKYIVQFAVGQSEIAVNRASNIDADMASTCKSIGELKGLKKIISFVDSMVEQRKSIQP